MRQVLITNLYFAKYTGSELHSLEMARMFEKKGYAVTLAVFQKAYPLLEKKGTIKVVNVLSEELEENDFDIIFVQHYPVFDYLCCKYNLSYKKLVVSKLSVISELECLPVCTSVADMILCVSQECANQVYKEIGTDARVQVFKNSVSQDFFAMANQKYANKKLQKIAIISNHVPKELLELSAAMGEEYTIDYIGAEYSPKLVDIKLLKEYDLVITIGRTVQQCFALKVPVYVYDYFGGPGYINDNNLDLAEENNFSGRGGFGKKTVLELKADIEDNYKNNLSNLDKLFALAQREYSYDANFELIYQTLMQEDSQTKKSTSFYQGIEQQRIGLYSRVVSLYALPATNVSQLYIDRGSGLNEETSIKWNASENYIVTRKFNIDNKVRSFRFDPCDVPAECYIFEIRINGIKKEEYSEKKETFLNYDPQFMIELSSTEKELGEITIEIVYKFKTIDLRNVISTRENESIESQNQLAVLENEIEILQDTIQQVREYYKLTPKNLIKRMIQFLKRILRFT